MRLQKLLKISSSFVNGRYSNSLDVILLGWLPISERIDTYTITLAHEAIHHIRNFRLKNRLDILEIKMNF